MATQVLNTRLLRDNQLTQTKALPAAAANNNTGTFDLGVGPYHPEEIVLEMAIPALAAHTDSTKNVTLKLQDSADDSTYADLSPLHEYILAGIASTGTAAKTIRLRLPPGIRRYLQINQAVDSGGPTLTASSVTYTLLF